ncbi:MAG: glycosyltransferase family 4 protein [Pyrinomonadaceae bacterium]
MQTVSTNGQLARRNKTVVSVFGVEPRRIGGTEMFARELSLQLGQQGWKSVLCFLSEPAGEVRRFLDLPNVWFETLADSTNGSRQACRNLNRIIVRHKPEILHLHFVSFLTLYPWIARLRSVKKVFFTDHHSRPEGYVPRRTSAWKRAAAHFIGLPLTKVICVSNYGYRCMTEIDLLPRSRFEMIYNGVDVSRVNPDPDVGKAFRRRFSISNDRPIVTQVSWMIPEKGISDFLEMARRVRSQRTDVQFVLVGDGANREAYMKEAAALGLGDQITFTKTIDDPFGDGVFQAADVVCQFSRWEEVFGWMIAEAMAHAKPVVATRVGGIPELIVDGSSGFLVDRGDVEGMSKRVLELLDVSARSSSMGDAARQTVQAKFNLQANVSQLVRSYGLTAYEARASATATSHSPDPARSDCRAADPRKISGIDPLLVLEEKS